MSKTTAANTIDDVQQEPLESVEDSITADSHRLFNSPTYSSNVTSPNLKEFTRNADSAVQPLIRLKVARENICPILRKSPNCHAAPS
jgi:hypothetical protein